MFLFFIIFLQILKFFYLDIKNDFSKDDKYLAVITSNGLWIKDETEENINLINADKIENNYLKNVIITQFNKNFEFQRIISSEKVNIKKNIWLVNNPSITKENELTKKKKKFYLKQILI